MADVAELVLQIKDLQERLEQRNTLLDVIRKAYHHDVLVIRENLLHSKIGESSDLGQHEGKYLKGVPSIDLRNQGLHLFAPEECELRLKPCYHCGGQLEVIHRESSRLSFLIECRDELYVKLAEIQEKLRQSRKQIENGNSALRKLEEESVSERGRLLDEIAGLKATLIDHEELKVRHKKLQCEMEMRNGIFNEKEEVTAELDMTRKDLSNSKLRGKELEKKIENNYDTIEKIRLNLREVFQSKTNIESDYEDLLTENEESKKERKEMKEKMKLLDEELKEAKTEITRMEILSRQAEVSHSNLKKMTAQIEKGKNDVIDRMKLKENEFKQTIEKLKSDLHSKEEETKSCRLKMEDALKRFHDASLIECNLRKKAADESIEDKNKELEALQNLTSSFIRGTYDHCLTQEKILQIEGFLAKSCVKNAKIENENLNHVLHNLNKRLESRHFNWDELLNNATDRRQIFGNLNNRLQRNLHNLDTLIENIRARHEAETERIKNRNNEKMEELVCSYKEKIDQLETSIQLKDNQVLSLSKKYEIIKRDCDESKTKLQKQIIECSQKRGIISELNKRLSENEKEKRRTAQEIVEQNEGMEILKKAVQEQDLDIKKRDETLVHLEKVLEKSIARYAETIAKERNRLENNRDVAIQNIPHVEDFNQQVDFVLSTSSMGSLTQPPRTVSSSRSMRIHRGIKPPSKCNHTPETASTLIRSQIQSTET